MEFKFNVSEIFPGPIVEINQNLIPSGFTGDRRSMWDAITKVSEVVNSMGDASAVAQGLTKPITTAERLRNSEQTVYLLVDRHAKNGKGVVTGMLKTGKKSLYVFDRDGHHYQVSPTCVLDFYVHESRQRTGLGKQLFEHMLKTERVEPVKMAVDRPSEKLLSFLDKHYGLNNAVRQMNNYVIYDGFFPDPQIENMNGDGSNSDSPSKARTANGLQGNYTSPYGRYGAPRPPCSMGQIIHNQSPVQSNEPTGVSINQKVTQSAPTVQYQQQVNNSNQGYPEVCQSSPNVPYQQAQPNVQNYGMQQQSYPSPYSNMQQQYLQNQQGQTVSTNHYEEPMFQHKQEQKPTPKVYNNGMSPRQNEPTDNENVYFKDRYKSEQVQQQKQVASQPNIPVRQHYYQPVQQMSQGQFAQTEYAQSLRQVGNGAGIHEPQYSAPYPQTPQHPINSPQMVEQHQKYEPPFEPLQSPSHPVCKHSQQNLQQTVSQPLHQHPQQSPQHQHVQQTVSQHYQHPHQTVSQPLHQHPQQSYQHHHPQQTISQPSPQHQYPHQTVSQQPQQRVSFESPADSQHYVNHQQQIRPQTASHSHHLEQTPTVSHVHHQIARPHTAQSSYPSEQMGVTTQSYQPQQAQQMAASYQSAPHQHHHIQKQPYVPQFTQDASARTATGQYIPYSHQTESDTVPSQQHVHHMKEQPKIPHFIQDVMKASVETATTSQHIPYSQQMVSDAVPTQQHVHHHGHTQQMVQSGDPQANQGQHQHMLQFAQQQSMPTVAHGHQQHLPQIQSMPTLPPGQGNVQYQQYIQPPNTEQPVYAKSEQPEENEASTKYVPYQYFDSATGTMHTRYSRQAVNSLQTSKNVYAQQAAAGDMAPLQNIPEDEEDMGYPPQHQGITTDGELVRVRPPKVFTQRKIGNDTVSGLLRDASSQMSTNKRNRRGQQYNGEQHKALDDSVGQSPKLERPRSLSIQRSEEAENVDKKVSNDIKSGVHYKKPEKKSADELDNIENDVAKVEIAESVPKLNAASENGSDDSESRSKSPNPLTAQGFFDLKFYHSRLW